MRPTTPDDMKLTALAGAVALALTAAPAQATPLYAFSIASSTCALKATGMSQDQAMRAAIRSAWDTYGDDITRDGSDVASRYVVVEQSRLCSLK